MRMGGCICVLLWLMLCKRAWDWAWGVCWMGVYGYIGHVMMMNYDDKVYLLFPFCLSF